MFAALVQSIYAVSTGGGGTPSIGDSGAISGVLGAYLVMFPRARIYTLVIAFFIRGIRIPAIAFIPFWFILQILFSVIGESGGVAYLAHIGGFIAGVGSGYMWKQLVHKTIFSNQRTSSNRKELPRIRDAALSLEPEVIEGPDFIEIIAEIHGISDAVEIDTYFEPDKRGLRIVVSGSRNYELFAKLPDSAANSTVEYIHFRNGIARIRLTK